MQTLGVPYPEGYDQKAVADLKAQAEKIAETLKKDGIEVSADKEIIAMIAYIQRLGVDISSGTEVKKEEVVINFTPLTDAESLAAGEALYAKNCVVCHGTIDVVDRKGLVGPSLFDDQYIHGGTANDIFKATSEGVPEKGMQAWKHLLAQKDMENVVSFVISSKK